MDSPTPPPYRYSCDDRSLLLYPLKQWIVRPLFRLIPRWIPANLITLLSACCVYAAFALAHLVQTPSSWVFAVIGLLILAYTVGDHLDGMQAKHTQTGSPLGEFVDHYSDVYNTSLLLFMLCTLFSIQDIRLLAGILFGAQLAQATIYYEQFHTRHLQFERFSSLEGLFLMIVVCLSCAYPPIYQWFRTPVVVGISPILFLLLFSSAAGLYTAISCMWRLHRWEKPWLLYVVLHTMIAILGAQLLTPWMLLLLMMLHNTNTIGRWMRGHLVDHTLRYPDIIAPILLGVMSLFAWWQMASPLRFSVLGVALVYLAFDNIRHIVGVFQALREYWFWRNPS